MTHPHFFGYGSLVNRDTHSYTPAHPARVSGWRRVWRCAPARPVAFLSVVPDDACQIEGLIAAVPGDDWAALDAREFSYARQPVTEHVTHEAPDVRDISIYAIPGDGGRHPDDDHPILLSYVDAVLQGFLREYGHTGAQRFVDTTDGWDGPIFNDRMAPRYPRAQKLSVAEMQTIDLILTRASAKVVA